MALQVPSITQSKEVFGMQAWFQRIVRAINRNTPAGIVLAYAGTSAPAGWLLCDGSAVARSSYAVLFDVIGETYGVGDGSTTFNLPDLRGRAVFGKDNMGGSAASRVTNGGSGVDGATLGAVGGDELLQQHLHTVNTDTSGGLGVANRAMEGDGTGANSMNTANTGGGDSQNMPPAIILNYIIKV